MNETDDLKLLADILQASPASSISEEFQLELIQRGAVAYIEEAAGALEDLSGVLQLLYSTASAHPTAGIRQQAFLALTRLAQAGMPGAVDQVYRLAVEHDHLAARQAVAISGWQPGQPELGALFQWFSVLQSGAVFPQAGLDRITQAYFHAASPGLRARLLSTAGSAGMAHWAEIVSAVETGTQASFQKIVSGYPAFSAAERRLALDLLAQRAAAGSLPAREAICMLFIEQEDLLAREIAQKNAYLPQDPETRAVYLFLAEEWQAYEIFDFDRSLLINAYEKAGRGLQRRLMEHSRKTGQMEWIHSSTQAGEVRWINDLTDADWELAVGRLVEGEHWHDLWRLAQFAPPLWSAAMITRLASAGWQPPAPSEEEGFAQLARLAAACGRQPMLIRPKKKLNHPSGEITCLAVDPTGKKIAAGSTGPQVYLWRLPDGVLHAAPLAGPVPVTRALLFSQDGDVICTAASDHRLRVFRLQNGQIQKTLEGHKAMVRALVLHPDGRLIASAGFDGQIRFWRFPFGPEIKTIEPGAGEIFSLALGAGGRYLLSGAMDGSIRVWSMPEGTAARQLQAHPGGVTHLAASSEGEFAASAGRDGFLRLWNFTSGRLLRAWPHENGPVTSLALHPSGLVVASGHQSGQISLWNLSTGKLMDPLAGHQHPVNGLIFSPDGNSLYSSDNSGILQVWDLLVFLTMRLPGLVSQPGAAARLQDWQKRPGVPQAEKAWIEFSAQLALWRQRYDIEINDLIPIQVGEFDIELA